MASPTPADPRPGGGVAPRSLGATLRCGAFGRGFVAFLLFTFLGLTLDAAPGRVWVSVPVGTDEPAGVERGWSSAAEVVVRFRPEPAMRARVERDFGPDAVRWLVPRRGPVPAGPGGGPSVLEQLAVVRIEAGADPADAAAALARRPDVLYAEPNWRIDVVAGAPVLPVDPPNDFEFDRQWALSNRGQTGGRPGADIGALAAWSVTTGSRDIVAAIVDTGVDYFHPDLAANLWARSGEVPGNGVDDDGNGYIDDLHGYDFFSDDGDPMDDNSHGTHVAGILGASANDENGVAGVAWGVRLMALKAFDETGSGTLDDTISAIGYAVANGARIINASWGTTTRSRALDDAVAEAVRRGVVFVAAAGNNGSAARFFPAAVPEAIAVGATDAQDRSPSFSNYGDFVDLVAPGDAIHSTLPNAAWGALSGTSMAAPHVSGVAALLLSLAPAMTPAEVALVLRSSADEVVTDRFTGAGRLNAARAVGIGGPLPEAHLVPPGEVSGTVDLAGRAADHGFAEWVLELGRGDRPTEWEVLRRSSVPVTNGVLLAGFDTTRRDDGDYTVRLTVSNGAGMAAVDRRSLRIRNVRVISPQNNDVLRWGGRYEIRGSVAGGGRTFEVHWGLGHQPAAWRTNGIELQPAGPGGVVDGVLAYWDSGSVPDGSFVTLRLVAREGSRAVGEALTRMLHLESRLRPGFPHSLPFQEEFPAAFWREFIVADLLGNGEKSILFVDHGEPGGRRPRLVALSPAGLERWSRELSAGAPEYDAPVAGDLDGDGRLEVVVDTGEGGFLAAFNAAGEPFGAGWPVAPGGSHFAKSMADLDGDGRMEVIVLSRPPPDLVGDRSRQLAVLGGDGAVRHTWRIQPCDAEIDAPEQSVAIANLDSDAALEIVAVNGCRGLAAVDPDADDPTRILWAVELPGRVSGSPVATDFNRDGLDEIVVGTVGGEAGEQGGLHLLDARGRPRTGWPVLVEESFPASPALGDLDGDGELEIVVPSWASGMIHAVRPDGFELEGWPVVVNGSVRSSPVLGDVDGDGATDVVLPSPGSWLMVVLNGDVARAGGVRAWNHRGEPLDFQPAGPGFGLVAETAGGLWQRMSAPVLTDLDGNGRLDIVAASIQDSLQVPSSRMKSRSSLYAWELDTPWDPALAPWAAGQGDAQRSGRLFRAAPPNQPPVITPIPDQTIAVGGAFRPVPLDRYVDDPDDRVSRLNWFVEVTGGIEATLDTNRVLRVTASPAWEGRGEVSLVVRDLRGGEARTRVVFSARVGFRAPEAVADAAGMDEDQEVILDVLANDRSPDARTLRVAGVSRPASGATQLLSEGRILYRPTPDFFGTDTFEYTLADSEGGFAVAEVTVVVRNLQDPPRPVPDRLIVEEDHSGELRLLANDEEVDGERLTLEFLGAPTAGELISLGEDLFRFDPPPDYFGLQSFTYRVQDTAGLISTGEVSILVKPVNDPPRLRDQVVTLPRNRPTDVFYEATDADGDPLRFSIVRGPSQGVLLAYPTLANYEPSAGFVGTESFTYTATDGLVTVGPGTVTLQVEDRNNLPEIESVSTVTAVEQVVRVALRVRDRDGDPIQVRVVEQPRDGFAWLEGTNLVYEPLSGFVGMDRLTVAAADAEGEGVPAEVAVEVTDRNTPPRAESEVRIVPRNTTSTVRLRAIDLENNPIRFLVVSNTVYGTLEGAGPDLRYTPRANFRGVDRFQFRAADRGSTSDVAVVHLLVRDPNSLPTVTNQTVRVRRNEAVSFELQAVDPDGQALRTAVMKGPRWGRAFGSGTRMTYVPQAGFEGQDTFTYKVWDGFGYSLVATVFLVVERPLEKPVELVGVRIEAAGLVVQLRGEAGRDIRVEFSEDLRTWNVLGTVANPTGETAWVDPGWRGRPAGFFRAANSAFFGPP